MKLRYLLLPAILLPALAVAQQAPFGSQQDVSEADAVWAALVEADLAGEQAITGHPYEGTDPHGVILDTVTGYISVDGTERAAIVKRNYIAEGLSISDVATNPRQDLESLTVMVKREEGYDPENKNWFYAKYNPDGSLQSNPAGMALAGRVGKGMDEGCIPCHAAAPGEDFLFTSDRQFD